MVQIGKTQYTHISRSSPEKAMKENRQQDDSLRVCGQNPFFNRIPINNLYF
jgi:hypothetical protein